MGEINFVLNDLGSELNFSKRGLASDKMIYANPAKMRSHLEFASTNGVRMLTFDGEDELYKIAEMNQALPAD